MKKYHIVIGGAIVAAGIRYAEHSLTDTIRPYTVPAVFIALLIALGTIAGFNKLKYGAFLNRDFYNELKSHSSFGRQHKPPEA